MGRSFVVAADTLLVCLLAALLAALPAGCSAVPLPGPTPTVVAGENRVTQGTVATYGDSRLGFVGVLDQRAAVSQWSSASEGWLTRWYLTPGSLLPVSGEFLQLVRLEREQRDIMVLVPFTRRPEVSVPRPEQPRLPQSGWVEIGPTRIEPTGPITGAGAPVRMYPKQRPLADTPVAEIRERVLEVGDRLRFGKVIATVDRILPGGDGLEPLLLLTLAS